MDIWSWVHSTETRLWQGEDKRLAEIIANMPGHVVDDEHDKVDALFAEGMALAKERDEKWVQVYLRHWHLQSQVFDRNNSKGMLSEAVDLLDFTHEEDVRDCPQRICAVQDLAKCYEVRDGVGFVAERIEVASETLEQIDGSWPCYDCISTELVNAIMDKGELESALERLAECETEFTRHDKSVGSSIAMAKADCLYRMGRFDEAANQLETCHGEYAGEGYQRDKRQLSTLIQIGLENWEKAKADCLPIEEVTPTPSRYLDWAKAQYAFATNGVIDNDDNLHHILHGMAVKLGELHSLRTSIKLLDLLFDLALSVGAGFRGKACLHQMGQLIPQLNQDLGASERLTELQAQLTEFEPDLPDLNGVENPQSVMELEFANMDLRALTLEAALRRWPGDSDLVINMSDCFGRYHLQDLEQDCLKSAYEDNRDVPALEFYYAKSLIQTEGYESYAAIFPLENLQEMSSDGRWVRMLCHLEALMQHEPIKAWELTGEMLKEWPESERLNFRAAAIARKLKNYSASVAHYEVLVLLDPENTGYQWDLIVDCSIIKDWDRVRELSELLGIELSAEHAVNDQSMGRIRLSFETEYGEQDVYFAVRTGPATARVFQVANPGERQKFGHEVVFEPSPLNQLDQEDDEGHPCDKEGYYTLLFPVIHTHYAPAFQHFTLDGVMPEEDVLNDLIRQLKDLDVVFDRRSGEDYILQWVDDEKQEQEAQGLYAYLLLQEGKEPEKLREILETVASSLPEPLIWPELLETLGDLAGLEQQKKISEKYGM